MKPRISPAVSSLVLPVFAGLVFFALFVSLGLWQLDRARQKREIGDSFEAAANYAVFSENASYKLYQRITVAGHYVGDRQFLIENIVLDGQLGYYVITPFEYAAGKPLLLVNRGWFAKHAEENTPPPISVDDREQSISGRVGRLPRVAIRPGPAFAERTDWPRRAVWPDLDELAGELGRPVQPYVLLADPDPASKFERRWQPQEIGPMRNIGYAVQWFAMALAVPVIGIVLIRRKRVAA